MTEQEKDKAFARSDHPSVISDADQRGEDQAGSMQEKRLARAREVVESWQMNDTGTCEQFVDNGTPECAECDRSHEAHDIAVLARAFLILDGQR